MYLSYVMKGAGVGVIIVICLLALKYAWGLPFDLHGVMMFIFGITPIAFGVSALAFIGLLVFGEKK